MNKKNFVILFDLDGTLIDSTQAILASFYHSFKVLDFKFKGKREDIENLIGYPLELMYLDLGVEENKIPAFILEYKKNYKKISLTQTFLLKDAKEALLLASTFARLAIVTTKTRQGSIPLLENMGLLSYFECIIGREDVHKPKPDKEAILKALSHMNIPTKDNIYMIGDTKLDLLSAKAAKINAIGVLCGYGKEKDLKQYTKLIKISAFEAVSYIKEEAYVRRIKY